MRKYFAFEIAQE